ncbi:MAG TPA: hypothetical protein VGM88_09145 [Kofleriaceae bacterium]
MPDHPEPITVRWKLRVERMFGAPADPIVYVEQSARYANESCRLTFVGPPEAVAEVRASIDRAEGFLWSMPSSREAIEPKELRFAMQKGWLAEYHRATLVAGAELFDRPEPEEKPFPYSPEFLVETVEPFLAQLAPEPPRTDDASLYEAAYGVQESLGFVSFDEAVAIIAAAHPELDVADLRDAIETLRTMDEDTLGDLARFKERARARREAK